MAQRGEALHGERRRDETKEGERMHGSLHRRRDGAGKPGHNAREVTGERCERREGELSLRKRIIVETTLKPRSSLFVGPKNRLNKKVDREKSGRTAMRRCRRLASVHGPRDSCSADSLVVARRTRTVQQGSERKRYGTT